MTRGLLVSGFFCNFLGAGSFPFLCNFFGALSVSLKTFGKVGASVLPLSPPFGAGLLRRHSLDRLNSTI